MTESLNSGGHYVAPSDIWPAQFADTQALEAERLANLRILVAEDADRHDVGQILRDLGELPTPNEVAHRRLHNATGTRQGVIALYGATVTGEMEISVACQERLIHRSTLRYLARWIFMEWRVRRLVCRIRASNHRAQDFARRVGFRFEGKAAAYFDDNEDASVWVMFAPGCPWLKG